MRDLLSARFRTRCCKEVVEDLFYQFVRKLEEMGGTDHKSVFLDKKGRKSCGTVYLRVAENHEKAAG